MMADAKHGLEFLQRGVRMYFDVRLKVIGVELAPSPPTGFRRQRPLFGGIQIAINRTPGQIKPPGGFGFGTATLNEFHHPFPQVQGICFHVHKPTTLCPNVNVKCYSVNARLMILVVA